MTDKKCERLQLRLTPLTLSRLRAMAYSEHESMASFLEGLINEHYHSQFNCLGESDSYEPYSFGSCYNRDL